RQCHGWPWWWRLRWRRFWRRWGRLRRWRCLRWLVSSCGSSHGRTHSPDNENHAIMTLLSKSDQDAVAAAIRDVERETDAELVTVLAARSDNYSYIPLLWAGILALLVPGTANYFGSWFAADSLLLLQWGTFIVLSLLFRVP